MGEHSISHTYILDADVPAFGKDSCTGNETRVPANDDIHQASKRPRCEGGDVIPDRSLGQPSLRKRLSQNRASEGLPLHVTERLSSSASCASETFVESSDAGAERKNAEGR